jgi:hypothetical protein
VGAGGGAVNLWWWLIVAPVVVAGLLWLAGLIAVLWVAESPPERDNFRH